MKTTLVNAVLFCILSTIFSHAQAVCEQLPQFAGGEIMSQQCWSTSEVSGNVLGVDLSKGAVHISLSALSFNRSFEVAVNETGSFVVHSIPSGDYELLATRSGSILGFTRVTVAPVTSQIIFQLSNDAQVIGPGPVFRPNAAFRSPPNCIRSVCYVDLSDEI